MSTSGGSRGPVPKRSSQRRRRNSDGVEIATAPAAGAAAPEADPEWHPLARDWYAALGESGQATFMEPSDWAQARIWAELISRELHKGRASAQMVQAWASGATELLTTEGARRRLRIELERGATVDEDEEAAVASIDRYRNRRTGN